MGLFSSKSSTSNTQNLTDSRTVQGEGAIYANGGATVNTYTSTQVLDGGAIGRAFDFGADALEANTDTARAALSYGGRVLDAGQRTTELALDNLQATQRLTADAYADAKGRGALTDKLLIATVLGALVVAALAVRHA